MKKFILLSTFGICFTLLSEAQINNTQKLLGIDSIKIVPDYTAPFKKPLPLIPLNPQNNNLLLPKDLILPLDKLTSLDNMPVAKLNSLDHMPIAKLGDTQTTHFTMLIKPVIITIDGNKTATP